MIIDFADKSPQTRYHFMTQTIIPRPIAWILSENEDATLNLAPFSFFNAVCSDPALLVVSIGRKTNGSDKDTRINLLSGRPFVIHIAACEQAEQLNNSAAELAYGESELEQGHIALVDFPSSPLPRLAECQIAYHCSLYEVHELGPNKQAVIYAEIKHLYIADAAVEQHGERYTIDPLHINPLARLGGTQYAKLAEPFSLTRPK